MKIYVSGLYSGTNPQPGVGIARSLRLAYPKATLVGVEYSNRCSGIHWKDFDELWIQRPWDEINLDSHAAEIRKVLDAGAFWISAIDLEIMWLGSVFPDGHPNLLTPELKAIRQIAKPAIPAHEGLPVQIAEFVSTDLSDWELHAFCRKHNWKVWLKGPYYEAVRVRSWAELESAREILSKAWSTETLFLQAHVTGYEESITLSAYKGKLLHAVHMRKRDLTEMNKTWAGDVSPAPAEILEPLKQIIRNLNWSGGAELEMVRDAADKLWLLEWNPRFPAWIHGATIAGHNMSAILVEGASGAVAQKNEPLAEQFTRVVLEVPVRSEFPLPPLPEPETGVFGHSLKHPSGLLEFAKRLHTMDDFSVANGSSNGDVDLNGNGHKANGANGKTIVPPSFINDVSTFNFDEIQTPSWIFLENTADELFRRAANIVGSLSTEKTRVRNAYSIKTNPDERLLALALRSGYLAEAISLLEVQKAIETGFRPDEIVLNGPGKWWRLENLPHEPLHAVFCDSLADLKKVVQSVENRTLQAKTVGVRLRTPNVHSRFGIPVNSPDEFKTLINSIALLPKDCKFGIHFHMASSNIGVGSWWNLYESMLKWCRSIETITGREIETLDIGGGWFPDDWHDTSNEQFADAIARARQTLPNVREIISEPGKALAQPAMALAMRLLEIRDASDGEIKEAVVDGSIAELPMYFFYPHRILSKTSDSREWELVRRGNTRLLGRLCMEHDIVASNVELPEGAEAGDVLVFCDAGAYDRSMSYVFGCG
jgi:diaminopimelate decarboxylase